MWEKESKREGVIWATPSGTRGILISRKISYFGNFLRKIIIVKEDGRSRGLKEGRYIGWPEAKRTQNKNPVVPE